MKTRDLVLGEIAHRRWNFLMSSLAVTFAVMCLAVSIALLRAHNLETAQVLSQMEESTRTSMKKFEDDIRKSMKGLGFNIYIFPEGQDLSEVYAKGYASKTMPEEYVMRLANSKIVTVNHLLPTLTQKLKWPEHARTVILIGVRGEVPFAHKDPKKPLIDRVEPGSLVLGFELAESLELRVGDEVKFMGKSFEVGKVHDERGTPDDITIWINLSECQKLLNKEGQINAIQALECNCASIDRLGEIRAELSEILPGTRIIETQSTALARAEARVKAKALAEKEIADVVVSRGALQAQREKMLGVITPLVTALSMGMVAFLAYLNVRDRLKEVGILRAIGVGRMKILSVFLMRAVLAGIIGCSLAWLLTWSAIYTGAGASLAAFSFLQLFTLREVMVVLIAAPLFAGCAAWLPGLVAALKDPAVVLRMD